MATITRNLRGNRQFSGQAHYGNLSRLTFSLSTNASGAVVDSNSTSAVGIGDIVRIGVLPGGLRLDDAFVKVVNAWTASATGKIGFAYVDGVDDTGVPQDDDYFFAAGLDLATVGLTRRTRAIATVTLPKDAYLILTTAGAAAAEASELQLVIDGEFEGTS